jgi:CHAT domain-containing protein
MEDQAVAKGTTEGSVEVNPVYWLEVCRGRAAATAWLEAATNEQINAALDSFPILALGEFADAIAAVPALLSRPDLVEACSARAKLLRDAISQSQSESPETLASMKCACALELSRETLGIPALNYARSILVFTDARSLLPPGSPLMSEWLANEAIVRIKLAELGADPRSNLDLALSLCDRACAGFEPTGPDFANCMLVKGHAYLVLAEIGVEPEQSLRTAVSVIARYRAAFDPASPAFVRSLLNESSGRLALAELGVDSRSNLEAAIALSELVLRAVGGVPLTHNPMGSDIPRATLANLGVAQQDNADPAIALPRSPRLDTSPLDYALVLMSKGRAHLSLADFGINSKTNFQAAVDCYGEARVRVTNNAHRLALCQMYESNARQRLAAAGVEPRSNLKLAISLLEHAVAGLVGDALNLSNCDLYMGNSLRSLAMLGVKPRENIQQAIRLYQRAAARVEHIGVEFARYRRAQGNACRSLAVLGIDPRCNLESAVSLLAEARNGLVAGTREFALCLMDEATAHSRLAALRVQSQEHLQIAVSSFITARTAFRPDEPSFAGCLVNEGNARLRLADIGVEARENVCEAVSLYAQARGIFDPGLREHAITLIREGDARGSLSDLGVDREKNLTAALELYNEARPKLKGDGPGCARCLMNEANARQRLAELGVDASINWKKAIDFRFEAAERFLELGHPADALIAFSNQGHGLRNGAQGAGDLGNRRGIWELCRRGYARAAETLELLRASSSSQAERIGWLDRNLEIFRGVVEACVELDETEAAAEFAERARGRTLIDLLNLRTTKPRDIDDASWLAYQSVANRLAESGDPTVFAGDADIDAPENADAEVEPDATADSLSSTDLLATLRAYEEKFRTIDPEYLPALLPARASDMRSVARGMGRILVMPWIGERRSCAFLVRPGGRIDRIDLPGLTVATLRTWMIGQPQVHGPSGWLGDYFRYRQLAISSSRSERGRRAAALRAWCETLNATMAEVNRLIVSPIDRALEDECRPTPVAFVVGGFLGMLPLHAARSDPGSDLPGTGDCWLDRVEGVYGPSVTVLGRCHQRVERTCVAALGVSDTDVRNPLPFSRLEGRALELAAIGAGWQYTALRGSKATLASVRAKLGEPGVIAFSCHAYWHPNDPLRSGVALADQPLLLNELLGDHRCDQARLVVLSACETALGHDVSREAEDYLGLPAAFMLAGAKAVVGSLWTVSDPITYLLMGSFYDHLFSGESLASSLRKAQLWLRMLTKDDAIDRLREARIPETSLSELRRSLDDTDDSPMLDHPYYWAGFTAYGAPGPVVTQSGATLN